MYKSCIDKRNHHIKNIETKLSSCLYGINIFFYRGLNVDIFKLKISNEFFRRFVRYLKSFFGIFCSLEFLIQLIYFFFEIRDRIIDSLCL